MAGARSSSSASASGQQTQPLFPPKVFPTSGFEELDPSTKFEEETIPNYELEWFYPVRIGDVFHDNRYQVVTKLGYGATSTVWLARDLSDGHFVVLKVHPHNMPRLRELEAFQHLDSLDDSEHPGRQRIRWLQEAFTIQGPHGAHVVFVLPPLGLSVKDLQDLQDTKTFDDELAASIVRETVIALNFLHAEAYVVHTDVHPGNLLLGLTDESNLVGFEQRELTNPSPRKLVQTGGSSSSPHVIHLSQVMLSNVGGPPRLTDLGYARICVDNKEPQRGIAMPTQFRAPEVILEIPWAYPVDMWSVGIMAWDLLETTKLFDIYDPEDDELNEAHHLAAMVRILGPPPTEFLKQSTKATKYWDEDGNWRGIVPLQPPIPLETLAVSLPPGERRDLFLDFVGKLLRWDPEERLDSLQAFEHPWI